MFIGAIQPRRSPGPYVSELTTTPRLERPNTWPANRLPSYICYLLISPFIAPVRLSATQDRTDEGEIDEDQKRVAAMLKARRDWSESWWKNARGTSSWPIDADAKPAKQPGTHRLRNS